MGHIGARLSYEGRNRHRSTGSCEMHASLQLHNVRHHITLPCNLIVQLASWIILFANPMHPRTAPCSSILHNSLDQPPPQTLPSLIWDHEQICRSDPELRRRREDAVFTSKESDRFFAHGSRVGKVVHKADQLFPTLYHQCVQVRGWVNETVKCPSVLVLRQRDSSISQELLHESSPFDKVVHEHRSDDVPISDHLAD